MTFVGISSTAYADADYGESRNTTVFVSERVQDERGFASGLLLTELGAASLFTPQLEVGFRLRYINGFGPGSVLNVADEPAGGAGGAGTAVSGPSGPNGFDRPILRARQLIYGNYSNGRWYILELGFPLFNVTGFTNEYYRYWSQRIALHEALGGRYFDSYFELGATIRSLSEFAQPVNTALAYPPSVDALAGVDKAIGNFHLATDFRFEQALTETDMVGSNVPTLPSSIGAATWLVYGLEARYELDNGNSLSIRAAQRIYRWPDNDNFALWSTFDEGNLGGSLRLQWRWQW